MRTKKFAFCTIGESQTEYAGKVLSSMARGVLCLDGDLGSGKTVLARGIAKGLGIDDYITSPTFNIVNAYETDDFIFNHMDAYRITDPEMLYDIGFDEMVDSANLTVIEWAQLIEAVVDGCMIRVKMLYGDNLDSRLIILEASEEVIDEFIRSYR